MKQTQVIHNTNVYDAAEFTEYDIPLSGPTLMIMVSQSGETMDIKRVLSLINNNNNIFTLGIVNVVDSMIARETQCGIYMNAGREVAVASTKSFTGSLMLLRLL